MAPGSRFFAYPVLGTVRADEPQPASDEAFETLSVEELLSAPAHTADWHSARYTRGPTVLSGDTFPVRTARLAWFSDVQPARLSASCVRSGSAANQS